MNMNMTPEQKKTYEFHMMLGWEFHHWDGTDVLMELRRQDAIESSSIVARIIITPDGKPKDDTSKPKTMSNQAPFPKPTAAEQESGKELDETPCSRSLSESKVEEIIATLWTILWAILFVNHAPEWMLWLIGAKGISDHLCAARLAIREIRSENDKYLARRALDSE